MLNYSQSCFFSITFIAHVRKSRYAWVANNVIKYAQENANFTQKRLEINNANKYSAVFCGVFSANLINCISVKKLC